VPALADAEAVMAGVTRNPQVNQVALVANPSGAERAVATPRPAYRHSSVPMSPDR